MPLVAGRSLSLSGVSATSQVFDIQFSNSELQNLISRICVQEEHHLQVLPPLSVYKKL